jgi:FAD/FMN-containing dehydrogenase
MTTVAPPVTAELARLTSLPVRPVRDEACWRSLRARVTGELVTPIDRAWDLERTPWLVNIDQHPAAILHCADEADVQSAVVWAVEHGHFVTAQPRGHAARRAVDGALLLRTRALQTLEIDVEARTARVGAGVKFGELLAALDGTGLIALCGSNADPTVVGLALGGGVSWFSRKYGFTANSVVSFDVVDAAGERQRVDRATDPELFWALRGGGGDFAIVLAVELALFPATEIYGGRLLWPVEHAPAVLRAFRDLAVIAPRELTLWAHICHFPPIPDVPEPLRGRSFVTVATTYLGPKTTAEALLWTLRESAPVELDLLGDVPISRLGDVAAEPTEPMPAMEHSMLLDALDDEAIDALVAATADPRTCPLMAVQIRGLGGAFGERTDADGAVDAVAAPFNLWACGVPAVPELAEAIPHGFAAIDAAVGRLASGRRFPNFTGETQVDSAGYDADTLERLRRLKRSRDPQGVIRSNKPVLAD